MVCQWVGALVEVPQLEKAVALVEVPKLEKAVALDQMSGGLELEWALPESWDTERFQHCCCILPSHLHSCFHPNLSIIG